MSNSNYYHLFQEGNNNSNNYTTRPFVETPPYHHYVQQQRRAQHQPTETFGILHPTYSSQSDTTTTFVEMTDEVPMAKKDHKQKKQPQQTTTQPARAMDEEADIGVEYEGKRLRNVKRMFTFLFSKKVPLVPLPEERKLYPWRRSSYPARMVFAWLWPILIKGYKRTLVADDLWKLPDDLTVQEMHRRYCEHLEKVLQKRRAKHLRQHERLDNFEWPIWAVPLALYKTFMFDYTLSCIFLAISFVCQALSPLITRQLIDYVEYRYFGLEPTYNKGVGYTIGAVVLIFINGLLLNHFFHKAMVTGASVKLVLTKEVLLKSFNMLAREKHRFSAGRITSLMSTDLLRVDLAVGFQPLVLCFPIPVVIAVVLLLHNIGVTSLAGIGLFVVSLVACVLLTSKLFFTREALVEYTDERISLMREVLQNLKVIKFYAWEVAYKANITSVRQREMRYLFTIKVLRNFITAYAVTLPTLTSMVSFVTMWATGNMKDSGKVFSSLSLFSILAQAIMLLPIALATGADATIGFRRLREFLGLDEHGALEHRWGGDKYYIDASSELFDFGLEKPPAAGGSHTMNHIDHYSRSSPRLSSIPSLASPAASDSDLALEVVHADFKWEQFNDTQGWSDEAADEKPLGDKDAAASSFPGLLDINLKVARGEFVVITGPIGSGKSSLLHALAGLMALSNPGVGRVVAPDTLLCGPVWIQNASVRQNILFGRPMDHARYAAVLHACCLHADMAELPHGDNTEIGERGITLSGGQKARISLARAVYHDAATLLFDDVLLAVDARVGKHIITRLFQGLLRHHTRVLATHQLSLVLAADKIVFLDGSGAADVGTPLEVAARNPAFGRLMEYSSAAPAAEDEDSDEALAERNAAAELALTTAPSTDAFGKTMADEDVAVNAILWDVYKKYIDLGSGVFGWLAGPVFLFLVALATFCQLFTNTWLSFWMEHKFPQLLDHFYITFYVIFAVLTVIVTGIQFTMLAYMNNRSAELLNVRAMEKVLHAPMSFMDTNPLGRVLNRFTKDTDSLDNEIGEQLRLFIFPLATIIGIIILCICYLPYFAIAVPFLAIIFVFFSDIYSGSSREIKRLEAVQRSVVYNNFNETLTGMATIKAYKAEQTFIDKNDYLLNRMNEAYFLLIATQRWLCVHLDIIALMFALIICILCITEQFNISPSSTGLLLNYVIQIVGLLSLTIRAMTQVETEMNSVERLHSYAFHMPQEADYEKPDTKPVPEWPMAGYIQFNNVSMRYRPQLPLVLKDMTFGVYPGEKVGICGRTGAGKSSIMSALYRLSELDSGLVTIDGVDISQIGLRDLRSKLLIIPQDPVLFQGTVRRNLDPFQQFDDDVLWDSLRRSGLISEEVLAQTKQTMAHGNNYEQLHKFHLDQMVEDEGANFSLGEKQLIALARSLVRDLKILILDEATSSVDYETDAKIQETITREFSQCTILCIAHRLNTILHYDRIMVMDQGKVVEKGTPWGLFQQNGAFRLMCQKARITAADFKQQE